MASVVLLGLTLIVLVAEHVTISVQVSEAATPEIMFKKVRPLVAGSHTVAPVAKKEARGPGGSQPWVRWNYIP